MMVNGWFINVVNDGEECLMMADDYQEWFIMANDGAGH